jgi:hypothetical protein
MCLYDEGMRCKVAIGHGSDGRLRHGLRNKSTLESDENFEQNLLESQMVPGGTKNELKIDSIQIREGGAFVSGVCKGLQWQRW